MATTTPGAGTSKSRVREALARLGAHVRDQVTEPVDSIRASAERILQDESVAPEVRQAARMIIDSAARIQHSLATLEDSASESLAKDPLFGRQAPHPLTHALAGELTHLARQAESPMRNPQVALLKPRLKRAARLATLWLSTT